MGDLADVVCPFSPTYEAAGFFPFPFKPSYEELICFLCCKMGGQDISGIPNNVLEKNLYGCDAEPWKVFADIDDGFWEFCDEFGTGTKRVVYVITKLSKVGAKKTKRKAGCGTWEGQTKPRPVMNYQGDKVIGYSRMLNYTVDPGYESEAAGKSYYYMQEYSCSQEYLKEEGITNCSSDYVICKIIQDDSKTLQVNPSKKQGRKIVGG